MKLLFIAFFVHITFADNVQTIYKQMVPVAAKCGCFEVPILPNNQIPSLKSCGCQAVRSHVPTQNIVIGKQYRLPLNNKKDTRLPNNRMPNQMALGMPARNLPARNLPAKKNYTKLSKQNVARKNNINNLKTQLASLAQLALSTAELLSYLPVPMNPYPVNAYTLPAQDLPATGMPVYRINTNMPDRNNINFVIS